MKTNFKNQRFLLRLKNALSGFYFVWKENSFVFHILALSALLSLLIWIQPPLLWSVVLLLCALIVLVVEMLNTCIERLCDFIQPEKSEAIKAIKDIAAAAVLLSSTTAVLIALIFAYDVLLT
ncbi:MAG: diacylglycerol kinase [Gammaproteobacteria bacterium]|nr:diacylglycerol kinase [Gammaproteobacteria bacterium]MDH5728754.1 diacylglycerol kinase [Gammaproteobacteria bacterium]